MGTDLRINGFERGQTYISAFEEKFSNLGEKQMKVWTKEGKSAMATFQCADVGTSLSVQRFQDL